MRKHDREIKDRSKLKEILKSANVVRIAIMDGDKPYIVPLNYGYHENCLYIHCATEGKKLDLLRHNIHVCFEVEDSVRIIGGEKACKWTTSFRSIIGYGDIEIIEDNQQKIEALKILMSHFGAPHLHEFDKKNVKITTILKLKITEMTGKASKDLLKD
ncbi:MAG: pyridoxamine 5'-phosphate oxidase family protein [Candidatus Marinimicrobia bacterium]|nr:pyridoxamine 5'-phosphate oxidase family protein [Candidatus Neomarinimicrobiota bacterium]